MMFDLAVKSSTVRDNFSEYVDAVIHKAPKVVNRHRDHFVMMNFDHLSALIADLEFHATLVKDDDGSFFATLREIDDLIGIGDTEVVALKSLVENLVDYSYEYLNESFSLYFNAPNRKKHLPFVFKVMMQKDADDIMRMINAQHAGA